MCGVGRIVALRNKIGGRISSWPVAPWSSMNYLGWQAESAETEHKCYPRTFFQFHDKSPLLALFQGLLRLFTLRDVAANSLDRHQDPSVVINGDMQPLQSHQSSALVKCAKLLILVERPLPLASRFHLPSKIWMYRAENQIRIGIALLRGVAKDLLHGRTDVLVVSGGYKSQTVDHVLGSTGELLKVKMRALVGLFHLSRDPLNMIIQQS